VANTTSVTLDRDPASAGRARRLVRSILGPETPVDVVEIVELLVSEVVTNVIVHATSPPELRVDTSPRRVRVEVRDRDADRPATRRPLKDPTATSGRGLSIVDQLATAWGTDTKPGVGKCVWFEVAI
jgi:anti-sigma regulatory factor (Ser/Thr protein kinase)